MASAGPMDPMAGSPGTTGAAEELHAQFACLRRELVELLDRKDGSLGDFAMSWEMLGEVV